MSKKNQNNGSGMSAQEQMWLRQLTQIAQGCKSSCPDNDDLEGRRVMYGLEWSNISQNSSERGEWIKRGVDDYDGFVFIRELQHHAKQLNIPIDFDFELPIMTVDRRMRAMHLGGWFPFNMPGALAAMLTLTHLASFTATVDLLVRKGVFMLVPAPNNQVFLCFPPRKSIEEYFVLAEEVRLQVGLTVIRVMGQGDKAA